MIWSAKHRENKRLIRNYIAFLAECSNIDTLLKLCAEINRLQLQNKEIEQMNFLELKQNSISQTIEVTSTL